jgi:hypothetical protein
MEEREPCACGHEDALHDAYGCAAYLGAFVETAGSSRYCGCRRPFGREGASPVPTGASANAEDD